MRWVFCLLLGFQLSLFAMPAQVIVIRHGEKDPVTRQLSQQGQERAGALGYYLTQTSYLLQYGQPFALFASRSVPITDRIVPRTIQTLMPTAQLMQLPLHIPYNGYQVTEMADLILNNSQYDGKNIVICWNHSSIHDLINAFGYQLPFKCTAPNKKYPDCRFDLTHVMTFPAPPAPSGQPFPYTTTYYQQLLFGDLTCESTNPYPPLLPPEECFCNDPTSCSEICDVICPSVGLGDD